MVNFIADNRSSLENNEASIQIKNFFDLSLPDFELIEAFDSGNRYNGFSVKYKKGDAVVKFNNSWRGIGYEILINNKAYSLINFEPNTGDILSCSKKNLNYLLSVLKRFLEQI